MSQFKKVARLVVLATACALSSSAHAQDNSPAPEASASPAFACQCEQAASYANPALPGKCTNDLAYTHLYYTTSDGMTYRFGRYRSDQGRQLARDQQKLADCQRLGYVSNIVTAAINCPIPNRAPYCPEPNTVLDGATYGDVFATADYVEFDVDNSYQVYCLECQKCLARDNNVYGCVGIGREHQDRYHNGRATVTCGNGVCNRDQLLVPAAETRTIGANVESGFSGGQPTNTTVVVQARVPVLTEPVFYASPSYDSPCRQCMVPAHYIAEAQFHGPSYECGWHTTLELVPGTPQHVLDCVRGVEAVGSAIGLPLTREYTMKITATCHLNPGISKEFQGTGPTPGDAYCAACALAKVWCYQSGGVRTPKPCLNNCPR